MAKKTRAGQADPPIQPGLSPQALLRARAGLVKAAAQGVTFPYAVMSRFGEVQFSSIKQKTDASGNDYIEVYINGQSENDDPHFRVWNPPTLVQDLAGDIVIGNHRYRTDPLGALAETLALRGGRSKNRPGP